MSAAHRIIEGTSRSRWTTSLLVIIVVALALLAGRGWQNASGVAPATRIQDSQLLTATTGWALTNQRLQWTTDGGDSWIGITPPDTPIEAVRGVFFLNTAQGWVVASGQTDAAGATPLLVFQTRDAGQTWEQSRLAMSELIYTDAYSGPAHVTFVDDQHGWVVVRLPSSGNFSLGQLFRTTDGGVTWTKFAIPTGDPVRFVTPSDGWNAGGPGGNELYVTRDGGQTWKPRSLSLPAAFGATQPVYGLPTFVDAQNGALPVTFAGSAAGASGVGIYVTDDGGQSWRISLVVPSTIPIENDVQIPTEVVDRDTWVVAIPGGGPVMKTRDRGGSLQTVAAAGLPAGYSTFDFVTAEVGWARTRTTTCTGEKIDCQTQEQLLETLDGGQTWTPITP